MSRFSDSDIEEMDDWVRQRHIEIGKKGIANEKDPQLRKEMLEVLFKQASSMTWMSGDGAKMIGTVDGIARLVWQACHRNHPDLTVEAIRKLMFNPENVLESNRRFRQINGIPENSPVKKGAIIKQERKERAKKRAKTKR